MILVIGIFGKEKNKQFPTEIISLFEQSDRVTVANFPTELRAETRNETCNRFPRVEQSYFVTSQIFPHLIEFRRLFFFQLLTDFRFRS
jgi:hypothetical protein